MAWSAVWLVDDQSAVDPCQPVAQAQAARRYARHPTARGRVATPADSGLTPEELTNIRVYEGANRGVVNILTRTVSYDRFFMLPSPGEGAGSGSRAR